MALRGGRLCLSSIVELAKVLTAGNCADVLPRYFHLSRREAAEVAAAIRPVERPPMRDVVTVVAVSTADILGQPRHPWTPSFADESSRRCRSTPRDVPTPSGWLVAPSRPPQSRPRPHRKRRGSGRSLRDGRRWRPGASRRGEARGLGAGRGVLPVAPGRRRDVRVDASAGVRPRGAARTGRVLGGGERPAALPVSQSVDGAPGLRRGIHGPVRAGGPARLGTGRDWGAEGAYPRRRNFAITRFSPIPGNATVTFASGPFPSQARTSPSPRLGCVTLSPRVNGALPASGRWSKE